MTLGDGFRHNAPVGSIWSRLIKDAISAGVNIHFGHFVDFADLEDFADARADKFALTPFFAFLVGIVPPSPASATQIGRLDIDTSLQSLVNMLLNSGVDLVPFGRIESKIMTKNAEILGNNLSTELRRSANWNEYDDGDDPYPEDLRLTCF